MSTFFFLVGRGGNVAGNWKTDGWSLRIARILCWWGIWTLTISPSTNGTLSGGAKAAQYGAVVSPLFTILCVCRSLSFAQGGSIYIPNCFFARFSVLLFFSGIPTAEKPLARRVFLSGDADAWATYRTYLDETSILIPLPPALYRPLPKVVKRTVLLDFPFYQFDEAGAQGVRDPATRPEESRS
jgi:hypothetical protein